MATDDFITGQLSPQMMTTQATRARSFRPGTESVPCCIRRPRDPGVRRCRTLAKDAEVRRENAHARRGTYPFLDGSIPSFRCFRPIPAATRARFADEA